MLRETRAGWWLLLAAGGTLSLGVGVAAGQSDVKWSQPPVKLAGPDLFSGWDEPSVYGVQIAADDWICGDEKPVRVVEWWGSFIGWDQVPPPVLPAGFQIGFWTDVSADPNGFSHPNTLIQAVVCRDYAWEFAGWEIDPRDPHGPSEAVFKFTARLGPDEWFVQEAFCPCDGDFNGDGQVSFGDLNAFHACVGMPPVGPCAQADFNCDGVIDTQDENIMVTLVSSGGDPHSCPGYGHGTYWLSVAALPCECDGDVNGDGAVNFGDINGLMACVGQPPVDECARADLNCDDQINGLDKSILLCWLTGGDPACCPHYGQDDYPFGWLTRVRDPNSPAPDDAVVVLDPASPLEGSVYVNGYPLFWLTPADSWDLAFELATTPPLYPKWEQPPTLDPNNPGEFGGWAELSLFNGAQVVADDWACQDRRLVAGVRWWGTYAQWNGYQPPPEAPDFFHLAVWTDVPADPNDPNAAWSHPGQLIREWFVPRAELRERAVNANLDPNQGTGTCFRYEYAIPHEQWFRQDPNEAVFWLSVAAIYGCMPCSLDLDGDNVVSWEMDAFVDCIVMGVGCIEAFDLDCDGAPSLSDVDEAQCQYSAGWPDPTCCLADPPTQYAWGWNTRRPHWNDDAVRIFDPVPPGVAGDVFVSGQPIETAEGSWDQAFVLLAPPCAGDTNCDGLVSFADINAFVDALVNDVYCDGPGANADVNGNGLVGFEDINGFVDLLTLNPLPILCD